MKKNKNIVNEEKQKSNEYLEKIWNILNQLKVLEYYLENVINYNKFLDSLIQLLMVFSTIISIVLLFVNLNNPIYTTVFLLISILAQLVTLVYPYIFNFSNKIIRLSVLKHSQTIVFDKYFIIYITLNKKTFDEIENVFKELYNEHILLKRNFNEHPNSIIDHYFELDAFEKATKELSIYF